MSTSLFDVSSNLGWAKAARCVDAAVSGDRSALAALIRATQPEVWRFLAYQVSPHEADDLTQETYLRMVSALPRFEGRSTFQTWLLVIARRVVIDHIRARKRRPPVVPDADWTGIADQAGADEIAVSEWHLLLAGLAPERREALVLTQLLGLSYAEAADVCGIPVGTVRSRIARARDELIAARSDRRGQAAG